MNACRAALASLLLACAGSAAAQALGGAERLEFAAGSDRLAGHLFLPAAAGSAKLPAVVIVHGSGGLRETREGHWGRELAGTGFAAFAIDAFGPRGVADTAEDQSRVTTAQMVRDAFAALGFLAAHPSIDAARVAVMGMSKGGSVALLSADERAIQPGGAVFAAHVPLYPGCTVQYRNPRVRAPILMLIGGDDDYTGVKSCVEYAERIRAAGGKIEVKTYRWAHHGFDGEMRSSQPIWLPSVQNFRDCVVLVEDDGRSVLVKTGEALDLSDAAGAIKIMSRSCMRRGATIAFSPGARARAAEDIKTFLKTQLTP